MSYLYTNTSQEKYSKFRVKAANMNILHFATAPQTLPALPPSNPTHGPISLKFELDQCFLHINAPAKNENTASNTLSNLDNEF